jgi:hypothetical protein
MKHYVMKADVRCNICQLESYVRLSIYFRLSDETRPHRGLFVAAHITMRTALMTGSEP